MKIFTVIILSMFLLCCAQKKVYLSKDEAASMGFMLFTSGTEYINVVYEENGEEKEIKEFQIKFKNMDGFGKSKEDMIPWESVKSIEKLKKKSFWKSVSDGLLVSSFL